MYPGNVIFITAALASSAGHGNSRRLPNERHTRGSLMFLSHKNTFTVCTCLNRRALVEGTNKFVYQMNMLVCESTGRTHYEGSIFSLVNNTNRLLIVMPYVDDYNIEGALLLSTCLLSISLHMTLNFHLNCWHWLLWRKQKI